MRRGREHDRGHGIFWGLVLIGMGVMFLLVNQGILPREIFWTWWMWWPAVMMAFAAFKILRPRDASDVGSGVTMMLLSLWFFANYFEWWGLTWHTSWPLALVAVGAGMMARALAESVMRDRPAPPALDPHAKETGRVE